MAKRYIRDVKMRDLLNNGTAEDVSANQKCTFKVKAIALDFNLVTKFLEHNLPAMK